MKMSTAISKSKKLHRECCFVCEELCDRTEGGSCCRVCPVRAEMRQACGLVVHNCVALRDYYNYNNVKEHADAVEFVDSIEQCCREQGD